MYFIMFALVYGAIILVSSKKEFCKLSPDLLTNSSCILQVFLILVDSYHYGKLVVAPLNTILYNVFSKKGGPELYGVEGSAFYLINLMLNFNLVLIGSLFSLPMLVSHL